MLKCWKVISMARLWMMMNKCKIEYCDKYTFLKFHCPGCNESHSLHVAGDDKAWTWNNSLINPTISPSYLQYRDRIHRRCHSQITNGVICYYTDSEHALAGECRELPDIC